MGPGMSMTWSAPIVGVALPLLLVCAALGGLVSWLTIPRRVLEDPSTLDPGDAGEG